MDGDTNFEAKFSYNTKDIELSVGGGDGSGTISGCGAGTFTVGYNTDVYLGSNNSLKFSRKTDSGYKEETANPSPDSESSFSA